MGHVVIMENYCWFNFKKYTQRVHWGSICGSLLNSKEPFMLKSFYNDKKEAF